MGIAGPGVSDQNCVGASGVQAAVGLVGDLDRSQDAATSREIGAAVSGKGGSFLEAPVSGSKKPAEDGTLIILASGDRQLFDRALPFLEKMGKKNLFLGELGRGAQMKLIVNMTMGGMMAIFCEALALADKAGLSSADLLEVIDAGAIANPMFRMKGAQIEQEMFSPAFPLKHMQKDLRLAVALGDTLGQPLYSAAAANESFKKARALGLSDEDFCAVFQAISS